MEHKSPCLHLGTPCLLQEMTTKHDQTDNVNMTKIARKNKKYQRRQIIEKLMKADTSKNGH